jgi:hypothetical protein
VRDSFTVHDLPLADRPRERLLKVGGEAYVVRESGTVNPSKKVDTLLERHVICEKVFKDSPVFLMIR